MMAEATTGDGVLVCDEAGFPKQGSASVGVPHRCVVADADDGDHPNFLAGLEAPQEPYVVAVRTDFQVRGGRTSCSRVSRAGSGAPFAGSGGPKAGCARSSWPCAAGG